MADATSGRRVPKHHGLSAKTLRRLEHASGRLASASIAVMEERLSWFGRLPADQRASLVSSILVVSYIAFSIPAVIAGVAVSQIGLQETAEIYGAALIGIAALALALSGNLDERREPEPA